jgi:hypothetical protein
LSAFDTVTDPGHEREIERDDGPVRRVEIGRGHGVRDFIRSEGAGLHGLQRP